MQVWLHLSEEALEEAARQHVPGDAVCDGGEDPVELAQGRLPVRLLPGYPVYELLCQAPPPSAATLSKTISGPPAWCKYATNEVMHVQEVPICPNEILSMSPSQAARICKDFSAR